MQKSAVTMSNDGESHSRKVRAGTAWELTYLRSQWTLGKYFTPDKMVLSIATASRFVKRPR